MFHFFEKLKIFFSTKVIWRLFPFIKNRQLVSFSATEFITSWHFLYTINNLKSRKHRARLFEQLLEEYHHADIFMDLAKTRSALPLSLNPVEITKIYQKREDLWKLIVYSQVGEEEAALRFEQLLDSIHDPDLKKIIQEILNDEKNHASSIIQIAMELGATPQEIKSMNRKVQLRRAWENWLRIGRRVTGFFTKIIVYGVYYIFGPILYLTSKKRLANRYTLRPDDIKGAL